MPRRRPRCRNGRKEQQRTDRVINTVHRVDGEQGECTVPRFQDLPFDVHVQLVERFLGARDVVALGMTCAGLYRVMVQTDSVWAILLQRDFGHIYGSCAIAAGAIDFVRSPPWSQPWPAPVDDLLDNPQLSHAMRDTVRFLGDTIEQSVRAVSTSGRIPLTALPPFQMGLRLGKTWRWFYRAHAIRNPPKGFTGACMRRCMRATITYTDCVNGVSTGYGMRITFDRDLPDDFTDAAFETRRHDDDGGVPLPSITTWLSGNQRDMRFEGDYLSMEAQTLTLSVAINDSKDSDGSLLRETDAKAMSFDEYDGAMPMHNLFVLSPDIGLSLCKVIERLRAHARFFGSAPTPAALWTMYKTRDLKVNRGWSRACPGDKRRAVMLRQMHGGMMRVNLYKDEQCNASARQVRDGACFYKCVSGRRQGISASIFTNGDIMRIMYDDDAVSKMVCYTVSSSCPHPTFVGRHFTSATWCTVEVPYDDMVYYVPCPVGNTSKVRLFWRYVRAGLVGWDSWYRDRILDMIDREGTFRPLTSKPNGLPDDRRGCIVNVDGTLCDRTDLERWPLLFG